jgi:hypothetical protein
VGGSGLGMFSANCNIWLKKLMKSTTCIVEIYFFEIKFYNVPSVLDLLSDAFPYKSYSVFFFNFSVRSTRPTY